LVVVIQQHPEFVMHLLVKKVQARARSLHVQNPAHHADRRVVPQRTEFCPSVLRAGHHRRPWLYAVQLLSFLEATSELLGRHLRRTHARTARGGRSGPAWAMQHAVGAQRSAARHANDAAPVAKARAPHVRMASPQRPALNSTPVLWWKGTASAQRGGIGLLGKMMGSHGLTCSRQAAGPVTSRRAECAGAQADDGGARALARPQQAHAPPCP